MPSGFQIRHVRQGECAPVCTHCASRELSKAGHIRGKQRYVCRACRRTSYGLPPDMRPRCPSCRGTVRATQRSDGRMQYRCPHCKYSFLSEYRIGRQEKSKVPLKHRFSFWLSRTARNTLFAYVQAVRCTEAQAVRAVFRRVLTGTVFSTIRGSSVRSRLLSRIARDPRAAAMRFPSVHREAVRRMKYPGGVAVGRFQPTILGTYRMTVMLDDAAKEGLVYAMRFLDLNHADAARWLLTNAEVPGPSPSP